MSGRGYHIFVMTIPYRPQNSKSCIYNSQHHFIDSLELKCDEQVIGDNARLHRITNTYHSIAKRYCIPLTQEQFYLGDVKIKELASKQNFVKDIMIGNKLFDVSSFDYKKDNIEEFKIEHEFESSLCEGYMKDLPDMIKNLLLKRELGWQERYLIILYFKEKGYMIEEVLEILKNNLTPSKFIHCVQEEGQLQYVFSRDDLVFPNKYGINLYK